MALNINGLSSKLDLGILDLFATDYDIVCLTETLCNETTEKLLINSAMNGMKLFLPEKKRVTDNLPGTHGMVVAVNQRIANFVNQVNIDTTSNSILWLVLSPELLGFDLILGCVYLPCESSNFHYQELFTDIEDDLLNIQTTLHAPVCLIGDFNARTGLLDDFLDLDQNVAVYTGISNDPEWCDLKEQLSMDGVEVNRFNYDTEVNNNGRRLIELCQSTDLKIVNGRIGNDKHGGNTPVTTKTVVKAA